MGLLLCWQRDADRGFQAYILRVRSFVGFGESTTTINLSRYQVLTVLTTPVAQVECQAISRVMVLALWGSAKQAPAVSFGP